MYPNLLNLPTAETSAIGAMQQDWFNKTIQTLREHRNEIEQGTLDKVIKSVYDKLIFGNQLEQGALLRQVGNSQVVPEVILSYYKTLGNKLPNKLAFDISDSEILVWAEINDDDDAMETHLIMTEAEVNAKFHKFGFDVVTMYVEQCDHVPLPPHYQQVI